MSTVHTPIRHILITGGSSGIGEALALAYAAPGITLSLTGRNKARLAAVCAACNARGADAVGADIDATDRAAMAAWIAARDAAVPLDLVIANAGVSAGTVGTAPSDSAENARQVFAINVDGAMNTVLPAIDLMRPRRRGQIALVSSLAGFRGVGGAAAYGASKAAVRVWGEGLRLQLAADNIWVSVICPGFVRSRITDQNHFRMPFFMDAPRAAGIIMRGLAARRSRISFPWPMALIVWAFAALPDRVAQALIPILPRKA
jgi:short-subunit dehydrogenase